MRVDGRWYNRPARVAVMHLLCAEYCRPGPSLGGPPLLLLLAFDPSASDEERIMCVRSSPGRTTVRGARAPLLGAPLLGGAAAAIVLIVCFGRENE